MLLEKEAKRDLSDLLSLIKFDEVTIFPVSNIEAVPVTHMQYEVVFKYKEKVFGFSIEEAIKQCEHSTTVTILNNKGMHFFYTDKINKKSLWIPNIRDTIKEIEGTVMVIQDFPKDGQCFTRYIKAVDVDDEVIKPYIDQNLVIIQDANFYIERDNLDILADLCNKLWQDDKLKPMSRLSTLHNTTAF